MKHREMKQAQVARSLNAKKNNGLIMSPLRKGMSLNRLIKITYSNGLIMSPQRAGMSLNFYCLQ